MDAEILPITTGIIFKDEYSAPADSKSSLELIVIIAFLKSASTFSSIYSRTDESGKELIKVNEANDNGRFSDKYDVGFTHAVLLPTDETISYAVAARS